MMKTVFKRVVWLGRGTSMVLGLAVMLALVFGVATMALADNGDPFKLGRSNLASKVSKLIKSGAGPALELQVDSGAPLKVNPEAGTATGLSADELDGKDSTNFLPGGNLPSGSTIRGSYSVMWTADARSDFQSESIPFGFTLASAPTPHFVAKDTSPPTECPGSASTPEAAPGHLCIYETLRANLFEVRVCDPVANSCPGTSRYGAAVVVLSDAAGLGGTTGTWAVTAP